MAIPEVHDRAAFVGPNVVKRFKMIMLSESDRQKKALQRIVVMVQRLFTFLPVVMVQRLFTFLPVCRWHCH